MFSEMIERALCSPAISTALAAAIAVAISLLLGPFVANCPDNGS